MILQGDGLGTGNAVGLQAREIAVLLLRPQSNHLSRIVSRVAVAEAVLAGDVAISIFEDENGGFVHFDRSMFVLFGASEVDVRLFAGGDATVDFADHALLEEFKENQTCPRVEHLFHRRSIVFVLRATFPVVQMTRTRRERTEIDLVHISEERRSS